MIIHDYTDREYICPIKRRSRPCSGIRWICRRCGQFHDRSNTITDVSGWCIGLLIHTPNTNTKQICTCSRLAPTLSHTDLIPHRPTAVIQPGAEPPKRTLPGVYNSPPAGSTEHHDPTPTKMEMLAAKNTINIYTHQHTSTMVSNNW